MIFPFYWVIFTFQPFIFRGVVFPAMGFKRLRDEDLKWRGFFVVKFWCVPPRAQTLSGYPQLEVSCSWIPSTQYPHKMACNYSDSDNSCSHQAFAEFLVDPKLPRNYPQPRFAGESGLNISHFFWTSTVPSGRSREAKCYWQRPNLRGFQGHDEIGEEMNQDIWKKNTHARWFIPWPFWDG